MCVFNLLIMVEYNEFLFDGVWLCVKVVLDIVEIRLVIVILFNFFLLVIIIEFIYEDVVVIGLG